MKKLTLLFFVLIPLSINAQSSDYDISSFLDKGVKAPNTHHLGEAWLNFLVEAGDSFDYNITQATFSPNSTLDWHKHTTAQVLIIIEGKGYYQERDEDPIIMRKGDVIMCAKDTEHWHTSSADSSVSYIAVYGSEPTIWTEKLTREYYDSVAKELMEK